MTQTNAERFLDAFNRIETALKNRAGEQGKRTGFWQLVQQSTDLVREQKVRLQDMATLRNAIVHTTLDRNKVLVADPRDSAVEWLEAQADIIEKPPRVRKALKLQRPVILQPSQELNAFLDEVSEPRNYSQSPVSLGGGNFGIITTNTVARWVAANYEVAAGLLVETVSIADVLQFAEPEDRVEIRQPDLKVVDAIALFSGQTEPPPAAILLVERNGNQVSVSGLCVRADLPALYGSIGL